MLGSALGQSLRACGNLLGTSSDLVGSGVDVAHCCTKLVVDIAEICKQLSEITYIEVLALCGVYIQISACHGFQDTSDIADNVVECVDNRLGSLGKSAGFVLAVDLSNRAGKVAFGKLFNTFSADPYGAADVFAKTDRDNYCNCA